LTCSLFRLESTCCHEDMANEDMANEDMAKCTGFRLSLVTTAYDSRYVVGEQTRATTNFANFARDPANRRSSIRAFLGHVNSDLNRLLHAVDSHRYEIRLEILSLFIHFDAAPSAAGVLLTETMRASVSDRQTQQLFKGPTGLNFSSYLRDYDFRIVLPQLLQSQATPQEWSTFGQLHGWLTRLQFGSSGLIHEPLAIAISIAQKHSYRATQHYYPILGREYTAESSSLTDQYFAQMGLHPQFFRPDNLPAPLAIYSAQSLLHAGDYYLAALIAVMANFQRIYRPEIYLSHTPFSATPGEVSQASLANQDYELPPLSYDREERDQWADYQAHLIEEILVKPYGTVLSQSMAALGESGQDP
jgi:hypothetical protein